MGSSSPNGPHRPVSRRQLLQLASVTGATAFVGACAAQPAAAPGSASAPTSTVPVTAGLAPQYASTPTPAPIAATAPLICRDGWGARAARPGGIPHTISRMTLHHTAVTLGENRNITSRLQQHQRYHQDHHGWIDIAYHLGIDRNGNIFELRAPEIAGDTATSYDPRGHFLVVCEGDFDQEAVTETQLQGAAMAFAWATQTFGVSPSTLAGHRDFASTTCPGANLQAHLVSGELQRRVEELAATGVVDLQRVCGPDAAAVVASIEAGTR